MAFYQRYELNGVRYVHCGDDFWRLMTKQGYVMRHARRFTSQEHIESWIKAQSEECE